MRSERPLNALEKIFASCNVRFAVLLVLENEAEDVVETVLAACDACRLGHLTLAHEDEWMLLTAESATVVPGREEGVHVDDIGVFLDDLISREARLSAEGPMTLRLIPYRREQGRCGTVKSLHSCWSHPYQLRGFCADLKHVM